MYIAFGVGKEIVYRCVPHPHVDVPTCSRGRGRVSAELPMPPKLCLLPPLLHAGLALDTYLAVFLPTILTGLLCVHRQYLQLHVSLACVRHPRGVGKRHKWSSAMPPGKGPFS